MPTSPADSPIHFDMAIDHIDLWWRKSVIEWVYFLAVPLAASHPRSA